LSEGGERVRNRREIREEEDRAADALDDEEDNKTCKGEQESGKERATADASE
jgi:hypothetical protein